MATTHFLLAATLTLVATAASGQPAAEQPSGPPAATCVRNGTVPWEEVVRGCTALLDLTRARYDALVRGGVASTRERGHALAEIYEMRGNAHMALRQYPLAISDDSAAIGLDPRDPRAYVQRGFIHHQMRHDAPAIADFTAAIRIDPTSFTAFNLRGLVHLRRGNMVRALADFDASIRINPRYDWPYTGRGKARLARGDFAGAMADFDMRMRLGADAETSIARCRLHAEHPEVHYDPGAGYCRPSR